MRRKVLALIATGCFASGGIGMIFLTANAGLALATPTNCEAALQPDISRLNEDVSLQLAYLNTIDSDNWENSGTQVSASAIIEGLPVGASYHDFDQSRARYFQQVGLAANLRYSYHYLTSALSPTALDVFLQCAQLHATQPLVAWVSSADDHSVSVTARRLNASGEATEAILKASVTGGTPSRASARILGNGEVTFDFTRVYRQPMKIILRLTGSANPGAPVTNHMATEVMTLPAVWRRELRQVSMLHEVSPRIHCGGFGNGSPVPGTFELAPDQLNQFYDVDRLTVEGKEHNGGDCGAFPARSDVTVLEKTARRVRLQNICVPLDARCTSQTWIDIKVPVMETRIRAVRP